MIRYSMNDSLVENNPWPSATSRRLNWTAILPDEPNRAKGNWTWTLPRPPCKFAAVPTVLVTPSDRLSPRLAWSRKSTSLASLLPRSSASAYGGSVDFRSHCTRQCATGGGVSILPRAFRGDVLLHSSLIYSSGSGDSSPIAKLHRCRPRWRASLLLH